MEAESITSFKLAGEYFCFMTHRIRHILEMTNPTPIPLAKDYIMGIINNHGSMIPVVDLRKMIGVAHEDNLPEASIIIVSVDETNESLIGFKVDEVDEVFDVEKEQISTNVVLEVDKKVQKSLSETIHVGDKFIYRINLDELSKVIEE